MDSVEAGGGGILVNHSGHIHDIEPPEIKSKPFKPYNTALAFVYLSQWLSRSVPSPYVVSQSSFIFHSIWLSLEEQNVDIEYEFRSYGEQLIALK